MSVIEKLRADRRAKRPPEKPKQMPPVHRQAWNLATSLAAFVADGMKTVTKEEYEARLTVCDPCDERSGDRCFQCGCHLSVKARGRAFKCPLDKWEEV